jgi:polyhydroxyalkanoate synthesis repressor PhaR
LHCINGRATQEGMKRVSDEGDGPVLIKKYENRRLYSSTAGRHLTINEIAELVREGRAIHVVDATTDEDITSEILTQILLEQGRARGLPVDFLTQMIRLQEDMLGSFVSGVIGGGLDIFWHAQKTAAKAATETGFREFAKIYDEFAKSSRTMTAPFFGAFPWQVKSKSSTDALLSHERDLEAKIAALEESLAQAQAKQSKGSSVVRESGRVFAKTKKKSIKSKRDKKRRPSSR